MQKKKAAPTAKVIGMSNYHPISSDEFPTRVVWTWPCHSIQEIDSPALWANPDAFHAKDGIVVSACRMACFVSRDQVDGILNQSYNRGVM